MGLRFRKSIRICKGMKLNFGKTGVGVSFGTRGLHYTVHSSGRRTTSVGIPGTGISYVSSSGGGRSKRSRAGAGVKAQRAIQLQQQKEEEYSRNCEMVDDFNELLDMIRSIHEECSETIDWISLKNKPEPFNNMLPGPREEAALRSLHDAKPSFIGKLIPAAHNNKIKNLMTLFWLHERKISKYMMIGEI